MLQLRLGTASLVLPLLAILSLGLLSCGPTPSSVARPTSTAAATQGQSGSSQPSPAATSRGVEPAPTGKAVDAGPKIGGTFVDAGFGDGVTLQPLLFTDEPSLERLRLIYDPLLFYTKSGEIQPVLAKSVKVSDDKLSISMELKEGANWSDGKPITAEDVKFTFDKMMDKSVKFPRRGIFEPLGQVEVTGTKSFAFRMKEVYVPALDTIAFNFRPIPKHIFEKLDINNNEFNNKPSVSSGPFLFKEWVKDDHLTLVANDSYHAGRPKLDSYIFRVVKDAIAASAMLETGEADAAEIQPQDYEKAKSSTIFSIYSYDYYLNQWDAFFLNQRSPILADKGVRQALSSALDKKKMIDRVVQGFGKPLYSTYPSNSPFYTSDVPKFEYDPARARQLLEEAGWKTGADGIRVKDGQRLKLRVHYRAGNRQREQVTTIAQQYWKEIGVEAEVVQEEWGALLKRQQETHDFDIVIGGWPFNANNPNATSVLWTRDAVYNYIGYSNPTVDELFKKGATVSFDIKDRKPIYDEIQKILAEEQPYIFLWSFQNLTGVNKRIKGVDPDPLGLRWNVASWYSETGK